MIHNKIIANTEPGISRVYCTELQESINLSSNINNGTKRQQYTFDTPLVHLCIQNNINITLHYLL